MVKCANVDAGLTLDYNTASQQLPRTGFRVYFDMHVKSTLKFGIFAWPFWPLNVIALVHLEDRKSNYNWGENHAYQNKGALFGGQTFGLAC